MTTTTTALGTVPQKILDIGSSSLSTSLTQSVLFDTHGAEFIGFQYTYTKGGETSLRTSYEVKITATGEWVALPVSSSLIQPVDTSTTSRAFQFFLGKDVSQMRVRTQIVGTANGTTNLKLWAMLSAATFPVIGSTY